MRNLEWIIDANEKAYQEQRTDKSTEQTILRRAMEICIRSGCSAQEALDRAYNGD
jgi:hypothetical protein